MCNCVFSVVCLLEVLSRDYVSFGGVITKVITYFYCSSLIVISKPFYVSNYYGIIYFFLQSN